MADYEKTPEEILSDFIFDIKRWKLLVGHMEKETLFINRQLNPNGYDMKTSALLKHLAVFRTQTLRKMEALTAFKEEISVCENKLADISKVKNVFFAPVYSEQHVSLKTRFESFCKEFKEHKARILYYTANRP
jgi:hypothetical protein